MLTGQASDCLWYTRYFREATFWKDLESGVFQYEYWQVDRIRAVSQWQAPSEQMQKREVQPKNAMTCTVAS